MAPDEDEWLRRLEALMETVSAAHLLAYSRYRDLVARGVADDATKALLDESVQIAIELAPTAMRSAHARAVERAAQRLLDPGAAVEPELERSMRDAESVLVDLLRRQERIARELTRRGEGGSAE